MLIHRGILVFRKKVSHKIIKTFLAISTCIISIQVSALTFNLPATDNDGDFTYTWSGAGTYAQLFEEIDGSYTSLNSIGGDSGSYSLTRAEGIYTFKLKGCLITGSSGGPVYDCSEITKSISISFAPSSITPIADSYSYQYDELGRLITVIDPNANVTNYKLDNADNRINKTVD